jgi:Ricin-type beta-trefoil lectin domain-like/Alpha-L-arabinofuranosidase 1 domain/Alpha-L-arabinofuranosidase C-terminal domain
VAYDPTVPYKIINKKSSRALSVHAAGTENGSRVILFDFINAPNQLWHILDIGHSFYKIVNNGSGRVLATLNGGSGNGTIIHIWDYLTTYPDQHWEINPSSSGFVKITNRNGGRAVSCLNGGEINDTTIHLWDYLGDFPDQDWSIIPVPQYSPTASYRIINKKSGKALSVQSGGSANGSHAILWDFVNAEDQLWHVVDLGNGFYKIINNHSGRALSTLNRGSDDNTIIHLWDYLTTFPDQHWAINPVDADFVKITNRNGGGAVSCLDGRTVNDTTIHLFHYLGGYPDQDWAIVPVTEYVDVNVNIVISEVSRYMTGVCLENVNHEVYGGIYSQMIYGESFQEPPPYDPNAWYKIINKNSGTALSVHNGGTVHGSGAVLKSFNNEQHQLWRIVDIGNGFCKIVNKLSGLVLSTLEGGATNGTMVHIWEDLTTYPDQHWAIYPLDQDFVKVMNRNSRRALSCKDGKKDDDTPIHLWDYLGDHPDQVWSITPVTSETQPRVSGMWRSFSKGTATGSYSIDSNAPFIQGARSQRISYTGGVGEVGIENQSLNRWGMNLRAGMEYNGYLYVRTAVPTTIYLAFESASGNQVYAETSTSVIASMPVCIRYNFRLIPNNSDAHGRFAIKLKQPGSVSVGYVFLQPGSWGRFNDLPVRKDIVEGLLSQGNTILRFGGSSVNNDSYRWGNMKGPRERRIATRGFWYLYDTNGWGIFDFLNLAESAGFVGIPAVNMDETKDSISVFMDYVNGSTSTVCGQKRAEDGHPEPYNLRYLELGNEEAVNDEYFEKFEKLATAIWEKDPDIILIVGDFEYKEVIMNRFYFPNSFPPFSPDEKHAHNLAAHQRILNLAKDHGREVWFDCHVWTDDVNLGQPDEERYDAKVLKQVAALHSLYAQLANSCPGAKFKLVVFELNANTHDMHRALGNALAIGMMQRLGNEIQMVASANALQPDEQNDNGWDQGLLFFNPRQTWRQPAYYVTQMKANNYMPFAIHASVSGRESFTFDVTAMKSADGTTIALHVVNTLDVARTYAINLIGFEPVMPTAHVTTLAGPLYGRNTSANPNAIVPSEADVPYLRVGNSMTFTFAPSSFTIVKLQ